MIISYLCYWQHQPQYKQDLHFIVEGYPVRENVRETPVHSKRSLTILVAVRGREELQMHRTMSLNWSMNCLKEAVEIEVVILHTIHS